MRCLFVLIVLCLPKTCFAQSVTFSDDSRFFLVGDSFTNDGNADWAGKVDDLPPFEVDYFSVSGRNLLQMQATFNTNYVENQYDAVVIAGGVNDLSGNRTAAEMLLSVNQMIAATNGEHVILTTIAPFGARANVWNQTRQDTADEFDEAIKQLAANSNDISVFDISSLLDADDDDAIDPHLSNDGLHPHNCAFGLECGMSMLADAFITQFSAPVLLGDVNQDGILGFFDIPPFVVLLAMADYQVEADLNEDDFVDFFDIHPFIAVLTL